MASTSEKGFGARLQNAKNIKDFIASFSNYAPPRTEDSLIEITKFITDCENINNTVASALQNYTLAVKARQDAFSSKASNSIQKLLSPISKAVQAQYNNDSREYTSIMAIIVKMRSTTITKAPANPNEAQKDTISKSEMSYGSQLQNLKDLVSSLEQLNNFNPSNNSIKPATLKALCDSLTAMNTAVISAVFPLNTARDTRSKLFDELRIRLKRIKSYVASNYGNQSPEYTAIKGISI